MVVAKILCWSAGKRAVTEPCARQTPGAVAHQGRASWSGRIRGERAAACDYLSLFCQSLPKILVNCITLDTDQRLSGHEAADGGVRNR